MLPRFKELDKNSQNSCINIQIGKQKPKISEKEEKLKKEIEKLKYIIKAIESRTFSNKENFDMI